MLNRYRPPGQYVFYLSFFYRFSITPNNSSCRKEWAGVLYLRRNRNKSSETAGIKKMAAAIERLGMLERPLSPDLFAALIRNIVDQQISVKAAQTVNTRLTLLLGSITPATVAAASAEAIQRCGMTMRKAGYIKGAADAAINGSLDLSVIAQLPDNEVITQLSRLDGVGVWTAEMLLISSLSRPDIVSWGDLAIRRGMMNLYRHKTPAP